MNEITRQHPDTPVDDSDRALDATLASLHGKQLAQIARRLDLGTGLALIVGGMSRSGKGACPVPRTRRTAPGDSVD